MIKELKKYGEQELKIEWQRYMKEPFPDHLPKKYILAYIGYRKQEESSPRLWQDVSKGIKKVKVEKINKPLFKEGTRLIREYQGKKYEVSIIDGDFFYMGEKYRSLSKIAREITGTNWNGNIFFGVK